MFLKVSKHVKCEVSYYLSTIQIKLQQSSLGSNTYDKLELKPDIEISP